MVHVSSTSWVPDHCRPYAFLLTISILQPGVIITMTYVAIDAACFQDVESQLENVTIPHQDREEMKVMVAQCKKHIEAWKAHILRFINQDQAWLDILKSLANSSTLVVIDWAMKFIPRNYRESQAHWFGKRGISWHISVAMKNPLRETLQMLDCCPSVSEK